MQRLRQSAGNVPAPGEWLEVWYPANNRFGIPLEHRRRVIRVLAVRDLRHEPLHPESVERRPLLRRGRWLVIGWDDELAEERAFYLEAMANAASLPAFQIEWLPEGADPDESPERIGPEFAADAFSRAVLSDAIARLRATAFYQELRVRPAAGD
jgi:hypothetical protein